MKVGSRQNVGSRQSFGCLSLAQVNAFRSALAESTFDVREGVVAAASATQLCEWGISQNCCGDSSESYMLYRVPTVEGEVWNRSRDSSGLAHEFRLAPDEALVYIGQTPPEMKYFSYRSYLASRYFPDSQEHRALFASLGDTLNRQRIKTSDGTGACGGTTVIVTTANAVTHELVVEAATRANIPLNIINREVIPPAVARMGWGDTADTFTVLLRMACPTNSAAAETFRQSPNAVVLRLTPRRDSGLIFEPYKTPHLDTRGTGRTEMEYLSALEELRQAILARYSVLGATEPTTSVWQPEGYEAIQRGIDVRGETRDAACLRSDSFTLGDHPNEFAIAYGVNHEATGKASHANVNVFGERFFNGVTSMAVSDLVGSAREFLPHHPLADKLYVVKISRRTSDRNATCLMVPWGRRQEGIELADRVFLSWQAYIEPTTGVGPAPSELAYDRVIKFAPGPDVR